MSDEHIPNCNHAEGFCRGATHNCNEPALDSSDDYKQLKIDNARLRQERDEARASNRLAVKHWQAEQCDNAQLRIVVDAARELERAWSSGESIYGLGDAVIRAVRELDNHRLTRPRHPSRICRGIHEHGCFFMDYLEERGVIP
jgi:hypothetical protein